MNQQGSHVHNFLYEWVWVFSTVFSNSHWQVLKADITTFSEIDYCRRNLLCRFCVLFKPLPMNQQGSHVHNFLYKFWISVTKSIFCWECQIYHNYKIVCSWAWLDGCHCYNESETIPVNDKHCFCTGKGLLWLKYEFYAKHHRTLIEINISLPSWTLCKLFQASPLHLHLKFVYFHFAKQVLELWKK